MLIENTKKGREDGGYSRLFGNKEMGALMSRVHSASISNGNELEKVIVRHAHVMQEKEIPELFKGNLRNGVYLISKKILKKEVTPFLSPTKVVEPDFLIVQVVESKVYVIELKDGDNFDTKKAAGEVQHLTIYADALNKKLPYPWLADIKVCFFNQLDKSKIVAGFKGAIKLNQAMTGVELCKLIGVSYEGIVAERNHDQPRNREFFVREMLKIKNVTNIVREQIN